MTHLDPEQLEAAANGDAFEHLSACEACRRAVADARGRQQLLRGLTPHTLSDVAFRRVEARLMEQVDEGLPSRAPRWLWLLVPAAVAALAVAFVALQPGRPSPVAPPSPPLLAVADAPFHPLTVVLASGDAQRRDGEGPWQPLRAGEVLAKGAALSGGRVVLAPDADVPWAFEAEGAVALGGQATLAVGAGRVRAALGGAAAELLAGQRRVVAGDAAYLLTRAAAEVVLELHRGVVEVRDSASQARRTFTAPVRVRWADGARLEDGVVDDAFGRDGGALFARAAAAVPARPWGVLDVSDLPSGTRLAVDGAEVGTTPVSLLLTLGRHRVLVTPPGQPSRVAWADLVAGKPVPLSYALPEDDGREPDADALVLVMEDLKRQRPKLAACYEKWLKANPTAAGQVELELSVTALGRVRAARVKGDPISAESAACLVRTAKTLVLPKLGAAAELEVPLVLRPKGKR